jgi:hypothetical protein
MSDFNQLTDDELVNLFIARYGKDGGCAVFEPISFYSPSGADKS